MKEFIDKLIEKIVNTPTKCLDTYSISCPDIITGVKNGIEYGCASRQNEIIDIVNELAEEYINTSIDNQRLECRCKDCIHWSDMVAGATEHVKLCTVGGYMVGQNGYCVYGEKRLPAPYTEGE